MSFQHGSLPHLASLIFRNHHQIICGGYKIKTCIFLYKFFIRSILTYAFPILYNPSSKNKKSRVFHNNALELILMLTYYILSNAPHNLAYISPSQHLITKLKKNFTQSIFAHSKLIITNSIFCLGFATTP